ncbi:MAG: diheme cytochrome c [Candidatus Marinarcus sp.]|uniref:diheme cytochrome c n=1 Tax=Candidatus Marinarcus sp. TaxID=3100987 RepID=UPI003AFFE090
MKYLLSIIIVQLALFADGFGSSRNGVAPVNNALYLKECGSCHFAYQPGLLPEKAWTKMMGNLANHFDSDASLDEQTTATLTHYLQQNSAEKFMEYKRSSRIVKSLRGNETPDSISSTPYMKRKHDEIRPSLITQKEVKGIFNCIACHTTADKGIYSERDIKIPNYGRWE